MTIPYKYISHTPFLQLAGPFVLKEAAGPAGSGCCCSSGVDKYYSWLLGNIIFVKKQIQITKS
jgi:hypothetical protein